MRRRDFMAGSVATAALGVAGWPVYAEINAGSPVPKRIALVHPSQSRDQWTSQGRSKAYFQELDRLGYIEGKNLVVERIRSLVGTTALRAPFSFAFPTPHEQILPSATAGREHVSRPQVDALPAPFS
jgi:hypothetical protein